MALNDHMPDYISNFYIRVRDDRLRNYFIIFLLL